MMSAPSSMAFWYDASVCSGRNAGAPRWPITWTVAMGVVSPWLPPWLYSSRQADSAMAVVNISGHSRAKRRGIRGLLQTGFPAW